MPLQLLGPPGMVAGAKSKDPKVVRVLRVKAEYSSRGPNLKAQHLSEPGVPSIHLSWGQHTYGLFYLGNLWPPPKIWLPADSF